jgi:hypothetical protein
MWVTELNRNLRDQRKFDVFSSLWYWLRDQTLPAQSYCPPVPSGDDAFLLCCGLGIGYHFRILEKAGSLLPGLLWLAQFLHLFLFFSLALLLSISPASSLYSLSFFPFSLTLDLPRPNDRADDDKLCITPRCHCPFVSRITKRCRTDLPMRGRKLLSYTCSEISFDISSIRTLGRNFWRFGPANCQQEK